MSGTHGTPPAQYWPTPQEMARARQVAAAAVEVVAALREARKAGKGPEGHAEDLRFIDALIEKQEAAERAKWHEPLPAPHDDPHMRPLTQFSVGNRGPPDEEQSAVFTVGQFCAWAQVSRSTLYEMWRAGTGPRHLKAGVAVRITREAANQWLRDREAASATEAVA
jgi:predicted DNA-binding transcriptional regulator AlpA